MTVPEVRTKTGSREINISYVVIKARNPSHKTPIVFLQGGPGGSAIPMTEYFRNTPLVQDRDLVIVDQRGSGSSSSICSEMSNELFAIMSMDLSPEEELDALNEALTDCREEIDRTGYDYAGYNSRENAADIDDLRKHLNIEKWVLFGGSYGSRLALTYIRDFPESVESAVMTAIFPPEANLYASLITNMNRSLHLLFTECEENPDCTRRYGDLDMKFDRVIEKLNSNPLTFEYRSSDFTLNTQDFLLLIHQMLYERGLYSGIPRLIDSILENEEEFVVQQVRNLQLRWQFINGPMYWSVTAYEELPFNGQAEFVKDLQKNPGLNPGPAVFQSDANFLEKWHSLRAPDFENKRVTSDLPVLLINGEYDPITPPSNAHSAMKALSNSYFVEFAGGGHTVLGDCFFDIALQFMENPSREPSSDCASEAPRITW